MTKPTFIHSDYSNRGSSGLHSAEEGSRIEVQSEGNSYLLRRHLNRALQNSFNSQKTLIEPNTLHTQFAWYLESRDFKLYGGVRKVRKSKENTIGRQNEMVSEIRVRTEAKTGMEFMNRPVSLNMNEEQKFGLLAHKVPQIWHFNRFHPIYNIP